MKKIKHPKIIYNDDTCSLRYIPKPLTEDKIGTAVDYFKNTHLLVQIDVPPAKIKNGLNTLAFEIPHFPETHDPYVYIYELVVRVIA